MDDSRLICHIAWLSSVYYLHGIFDVDKNLLTLSLTRFRLSKIKSQFVLCSGDDGGDGCCSSKPFILNIPLNNCLKAEILCHDIIRNENLGVEHPCILLLVTHNDTASVYLLHIFDSACYDTTLKLAGFSKLDRCLSCRLCENVKFYFIHATMVCFSVEHEIHLLRFKGVRKSAQLSPTSVWGEAGSKIKLLGCKLMYRGQAEDITSLIIFIVSISKYSSSKGLSKTQPRHELTSASEIRAVSVAWLEDPLRFEVVEDSSFLPDVYGDLVTHLLILSVDEISSDGEQESAKTGCTKSPQRWFQSTIVAHTTFGQILLFQNGNLKNCLPLENMCDASSICRLNNCAGEMFFILHKSNIAVVVDANFQVKTTVERVTSVHICDFEQCGGDQLLLVTKDDKQMLPDKWMRFILTDFQACNIRYADGLNASEEETSSSTSESLQAAKQALEGRLQAGVTYVSGVQREFEDKMQLINSGFSMLDQHVLDHNDPSFSMPGLMPLLGGSMKKENTAVKDVDESPIYTSAVWQKVYDNMWAVGTSVFNTCKRRLESLTASAFLRGCEEQCHDWSVHLISTNEQVAQSEEQFRIETRTVASGASAKVRRMAAEQKASNSCSVHSLGPHETVLVVLTTKLPIFNQDDTVHITLFLSWLEPQSETVGVMCDRGPCVSRNETKIRNEVIQRSFTVGTTSISVGQLIESTFHIHLSNISHDELLVLDMLQEHFTLILYSAYSSVGDLERLPLHRLNFQLLENLNCWIGCTDSCFTGVRVVTIPLVDRSSLKKLKLTVFCRDESQLLLLVHALYAVLPDDTTIFPYSDISVAESLRDCVDAIASETDYIRDTFKKQHEEDITETDNIPDDASPAQDCQNERDHFNRKRKRLHTKASTRPINRVEPFLNHLHQVEEETNNSIYKLCLRLEATRT